MVKKDNNDIYKEDELFQNCNLLEHTDSEMISDEVKELGKVEEDNSNKDFTKLCVKIIDSQNKHIKKLEKDISEANKYILYCNDKIDSMCNRKEKEIRTYYHSQVEKTEAIINDKKYQISQIRKRISETENKINKYID